MNADELRMTTRATVDVADVIPDLFPLAERSLRRALEPGGELEHLALRVGRRVFIRVDPLRSLLGMTPDMATAEGLTSADADATVSGGPHAQGNATGRDLHAV